MLTNMRLDCTFIIQRPACLDKYVKLLSHVTLNRLLSHPSEPKSSLTCCIIRKSFTVQLNRFLTIPFNQMNQMKAFNLLRHATITIPLGKDIDLIMLTQASSV